MLFAQRPEATACAESDLWNKRMGRYVRRGSKGIALGHGCKDFDSFLAAMKAAGVEASGAGIWRSKS